LVFAACSSKASSTHSSDAAGDASPIVAVGSGIVPITGSDADGLTVTPSTVSGSASTLGTVTPGQIIVAAPASNADSGTSSNPTGTLRKVVSVTTTNGQTTVQTTAANLGNIISSGTVQNTIAVPTSTQTISVATSTSDAGSGADSGTSTSTPTTLSALASALSAITSGTTTGSTPSGSTGFQTSIPQKAVSILDMTGVKIVNVADSASLPNGHSIGFTFVATVQTGTVNFTPSFDIGASVNPPTSLSGLVGAVTNPAGLISSAHAIAKGTLDADFVVSAALQFNDTITGDDLAQFIAQQLNQKPVGTSTVLADYDISLPTVSIGPFNAPATAHFNATLNCQFVLGGDIKVEAGAQASATISAGAQYDGTNVTPVFTHTENLTVNGPTWDLGGDVGIQCTVSPVVTLKLWDLAAGNINAQAYALANARADCQTGTLNGEVDGEALAGARATADAKLDIFGIVNWEKSCTLFDVQTPKAAFNANFTLPTIPQSTASTCTDQNGTGPVTLPTPIATPADNCFGGTTSTSDAGSDAEAFTTCDHNACTIGDGLAPTCTDDGAGGACIAWICANTSDFCCDPTNPSGWDISCISYVGDPNSGPCASLPACTAD
jgi:hypothetical protein